MHPGLFQWGTVFELIFVCIMGFANFRDRLLSRNGVNNADFREKNDEKA